MSEKRKQISLIGLLLCATTWLGGCQLETSGQPQELDWDQSLPVSERAAHLDQRIDWHAFARLAVQEGKRYKALESFARERMHAMTGHERLPGLSPQASLLEWLFNRDAYTDAPIIRVKDKGIQIQLARFLSDAQRSRILHTKYMTPREFMSPQVRDRIEKLETVSRMSAAINRVRNAQATAEALDRMLRIVPLPGQTDPDDQWAAIPEVETALSDDVLRALGKSPQLVRQQIGGRLRNISSEQAARVLLPWTRLRDAWLAGDAEQVQQAADALAERLPELAAAGVYPSESQLGAEVKYYKLGKLAWAWFFYLIGALFAVPAFITRWRTPWIISLALLAVALGIHAYGLSLRWYILGRIPVANMFEAIVASAGIGIFAVGILELFFRRGLFLFAAHVTGFVALVVASYVLPGGGTIASIMGILDDIMLRIHTVLIIVSYALIFLAAVIAVIYLFSYYLIRRPYQSMVSGLVVSAGGALMFAAIGWGWIFTTGGTSPSGIDRIPGSSLRAGLVGVMLLLGLMMLPEVSRRWRGVVATGLVSWAIGALVLAVSFYGFAKGLAWTMLIGGSAWALLTAIPLIAKALGQPTDDAATVRGMPRGLAFAGADPAALQQTEPVEQRPVLAGGAPGDEGTGKKLPAFLQHADWAHLIVLNMAFVTLFVGVILGAVWADYSWGRPWGWDPKEVFAMNTWIVYAILIHVRFMVKDRGLWTAWLSVAGCTMMAFNWAFVNFYIVGLHSYA